MRAVFGFLKTFVVALSAGAYAERCEVDNFCACHIRDEFCRSSAVPVFRGLKLMITRIFSAFRRWSDSTCDNFTISEKKMQ